MVTIREAINARFYRSKQKMETHLHCPGTKNRIHVSTNYKCSECQHHHCRHCEQCPVCVCTSYTPLKKRLVSVNDLYSVAREVGTTVTDTARLVLGTPVTGTPRLVLPSRKRGWYSRYSEVGTWYSRYGRGWYSRYRYYIGIRNYYLVLFILLQCLKNRCSEQVHDFRGAFEGAGA